MKSQSARLAIYRKKSGAVLIAVQIALTLAILSNAMGLIVDRLSWSARLTGIDEANIFFIYTTSVDKPPGFAALESSDLALLRSMGGVVNAYATNSFPLEGGGWSMTADLVPDQKTPSAHISYYFGDERALDTLGVKLLAGRNFTPSEILDRDGSSAPPATGIIITRALAQRLFPRGDALGQSIYTETKDPSPIIGIIDRLQGPFVAATGFMSTFTENSVLAPFRPLGDSSTYVVRAKPGSLNDVMKRAQSKLEGINGSPHHQRPINARSTGQSLSQQSRPHADFRRRCFDFGRGHRFRYGGFDQLLGCSATPADRHSACSWCDSAGDLETLSDGKFSDRLERCRRWNFLGHCAQSLAGE